MLAQLMASTAVVSQIRQLVGIFANLNISAHFAIGGLPTEVAVYCELMSQPWDELGFLSTLGMPMLSPVGETVLERHPYIHHPAPFCLLDSLPSPGRSYLDQH